MQWSVTCHVSQFKPFFCLWQVYNLTKIYESLYEKCCHSRFLSSLKLLSPESITAVRWYLFWNFCLWLNNEVSPLLSFHLKTCLNLILPEAQWRHWKQTVLTLLTSSIFFSSFIISVIGEINYDSYCFVECSCVFSYRAEVSDHNAFVAESLGPEGVLLHTH